MRSSKFKVQSLKLQGAWSPAVGGIFASLRHGAGGSGIGELSSNFNIFQSISTYFNLFPFDVPGFEF
jgi:hypothetical protein